MTTASPLFTDTAITASQPSPKTGHVVMRGLEKTFGGTTKALNHFDCEFHPGEMVVLLGPSGCGKTTALRVLTGLEHVDEGTVLLDGVDITHRSPAKRNMAMVFQAYSLFPHLTAQENVEFGLRVRKVGTDQRRQMALQALEMVGLAEHAGKYTAQMSGGQQQRVALARALVVRPSLLALDEPLSALDAKVRVNLRDQIRRIQQDSGITTLFVTHDQEEALAVADRVGVMHAGSLVQLGSPKEIYDEPANEFVASFIGTTNRLPAIVRGGTAEIYGERVPVLPGSTVREGLGMALVRPESMTLALADDARPSAAGLHNEGIITGMSFLGASVRVEVRLAGLELVTAQLTPGAADSFQVGDLVEITVRPKPVLVVEVPSSSERRGERAGR